MLHDRILSVTGVHPASVRQGRSLNKLGRTSTFAHVNVVLLLASIFIYYFKPQHVLNSAVLWQLAYLLDDALSARIVRAYSCCS